MTQIYRLHYAPDNASLIIRLALDEMGLAYETVLVDRRTRAQKSPAYLHLNPAGLIPVLETPTGPIFETAAILLWLADRHAMMAPSVNDPGRGGFLKWLFFISNTVHADLRLTFYPALYAGPLKPNQSALRATTQTRLAHHLSLLDDLAREAPTWFTPDAPSLLGYYVACLMRWMALYPKDGDRAWFPIRNTPNLDRMLQTHEDRPATAIACRAEGLGPTPFTKPQYATPPEGSPT
jgi:glutathione S-transferase